MSSQQNTNKRKRGQVRDRLRWPKSSTAATPTPTAGPSNHPPVASASVLSSAPTPTQTQGTLLSAALKSLTSKERAVIFAHVPQGQTDVNAAVSQAYAAAETCKSRLEASRIRFTFGRRTVVLRDEADKVLRWLDRFRAVGDILANVDPVHVGLPWAGIRAILEVAVRDRRQMGAVVTGMDIALDMASMLEVYYDFYQRLKPSKAAGVLRKVMITAYADVLQFIARAILIVEEASVSRIFKALWQTSDLIDLESQKHGQAIEAAAQSCYRELEDEDRAEAKRWRNDLQTALHKLDDIRSIQESLAQLHLKADLSRLVWAEGATFDSYADSKYAQCLAGTRVQLLQTIYDWHGDSQSKSIFWLCGKAGTGKSTICRSVAQHLEDKGNLVVSFFFKRGERDRAHARRFLPTIAKQLADRIPVLGEAMAFALKVDSLLCERNLQTQFNKLILQPLRTVEVDKLPDITIVVDALDECGETYNIKPLLNFLGCIGSEFALCTHILVTSRPDLPIRTGFQSIDGNLHQDIILEHIQASSIDGDLRIYFRDRFKAIREERLEEYLPDELPPDWPGDESIQKLVERSSPLFIVAFTICQFVSGSHPQKRLDTMIGQQHEGALSGLELTYIPILEQLIAEADEQQQSETIERFKKIVGSIVLLGDPLPILALSRLLAIDPPYINDIVRRLHSVLEVEDMGPIRIFHLSFSDFLLDLKLEDTHKFCINRIKTHQYLLASCLSLLSQSGVLKQDICGVRKPATRRVNVDQKRIAASIPSEVVYACRYWVVHLYNSETRIHDNGAVHRFLKENFLYWIEAMSWLDQISDIIGHLSEMLSLIKADEGTQITAFLIDAHRFVLQNRSNIETSPLQLYYSALFFAPSSSVIRNTFERPGQFDWLHLSPPVPRTWRAQTLQLEGSRAHVEVVMFSPDGLTLLSGNSDASLTLWNGRTGQDIRELMLWDRGGLAFAPDSCMFAFSCTDEIIRLANTKTGEVEIELTMPDEVKMRIEVETRHRNFSKYQPVAIAFSPNGMLVATSNNVGIVRLWSLETTHLLRTFTGSFWSVQSLSFSLDEERIFVAGIGSNYKPMLNSFDVLGEEQERRHGCGCPVDGVYDRFSHIRLSQGGKHILITESSGRTRVWDHESGRDLLQLKSKLETDTDWHIQEAALSPDGAIVAKARLSGVILLWSVHTSKIIQTLQPESGIITALAFSAAGEKLLCGTGYGTCQVWTVQVSGGQVSGESSFSKIDYEMITETTVGTPSATATQRIPEAESRRHIIDKLFITPNLKLLGSFLDGAVKVWDMHTCKILRTSKRPIRVEINSTNGGNNRLVAVRSLSSNKIELWDGLTGTKTSILEAKNDHQTRCDAVSVSSDCERVAASFSDGTVRILKSATGEEIRRYNFGPARIFAVAISPFNREVVILAAGTKVHVYESDKERCVIETGTFGNVTTVALSQDGETMATGGDQDGVIRLWCLSTRKVIRRFVIGRRVDSMTFQEDGKGLLTSIGVLDLRTSKTSQSISEEIWWPESHFLTKDYIGTHNEELMWLPPEYRGRVSAVNDDTIVIGRESCEVSFFKFAKSSAGAYAVTARKPEQAAKALK